MTDREQAVLNGIRFAAGVASDPSSVVSLWKVATGGKAVGCLLSAHLLELPHAAGLLPIGVETREDRSLLSGWVDAWLVGSDPSGFPVPSATTPRFAFPAVPPVDLEEALERIEALAEWVAAVSGSPASEGEIWKSIRTYAIRRSLLGALDERSARESAFLTPEERGDIVRAGNFLPPEAHSRLLSAILGIEPDSAVHPTEAEKGDPLILLARRLM